MPYRDPDRRRAAQRGWARRHRAGTATGPTPRPRLIDPDAGGSHLLDSAERVLAVLAVLAEQVALVHRPAAAAGAPVEAADPEHRIGITPSTEPLP